jgi:ABC-2 type transport system permease protein
MTAATLTLAPVAPGGGLTFGRVLNSEWIKFRTVRSTLWTLPLTAVSMIGFAVLQAWGVSTLDTNEDFTASAIITGGTLFGQVVVSVLAVLTITGEYTTGQIRSSLAAVPRRLPVLWAKAVILAASVAVVGVVSVALAWLGSLPFLNDMGISLDLSNGDTVRALCGAPLYLAATALFAFAVGALLRHSAGALALVLGLLLVLENVFAALPFTFFEKVSPFLPSTAGSRILSEDSALDTMNMVTDGVHLTPWQGYGVLLAWVAVLLTVAAVLLRRRDA